MIATVMLFPLPGECRVRVRREPAYYAGVWGMRVKPAIETIVHDRLGCRLILVLSEALEMLQLQDHALVIRPRCQDMGQARKLFPALGLLAGERLLGNHPGFEACRRIH